MDSPLGNILDALAAMVIPGVTTKFLDDQAELLCSLHKVTPAFKGYKPPNFGGENGFPNSLCVSINEEVIHGIPSDRKIQDGDVVKLDMGIEKDGQFDDGATTVLVGTLDEKTGHLLGTSAVSRKLVKATKEALEAGVAQAKFGKTTHDIAAAIEAVAKKYDLHIVHGFGGHGIAGSAGPVKLEKGTRIAIEPMFGTNHGFTYTAKDGWTVKLRNGGLAAHFEQTVTIE